MTHGFAEIAVLRVTCYERGEAIGSNERPHLSRGTDAVSRLLIVANRLPITARDVDGDVQIEPSTGGLATGLGPLHARGDGLWIGWTGAVDSSSASYRRRLEAELVARRLVCVPLGPDDVERFYDHMSNGILWPVFHHQSPPPHVDEGDWRTYEAVNERFADVVARHYANGDRIWVHDYHLLLLPELLRRRLPHARIGFFLHIPFPSSEVFRTLPGRERLLTGMLGADVIGFHTASYMRCFAAAVMRILGVIADVDKIRLPGRDVTMGVFPMGIDARAFEAVAAEPSVEEEVRAIRGDTDTRLLVGIDRLDYTKGIPRRLLAFERLLERHPELHGRIRLVQVGVPSREDVGAYQALRAQAYELVGRIHGRFATPHWVPIHWINRALTREAVVALYRAADVMLVTPIRDGMNLVAKEFVASRSDGDGVLVLSEFAGASAELAEAVHVNPYDVDGASEIYHQALCMREEERRFRMRALRRRVFAYDVEHWARSFLGALAHAPLAEGSQAGTVTPPEELRALETRIRTASDLVLLLDFDGTLVPLAPTPELAQPDPDLLALLTALARRPRTQVHVASGRSREMIERWLGTIPITLHVEHGLQTREAGSSEWTTTADPPLDWRASVNAILDDWSARTPGSFVEEKSACSAWHYRTADPEFANHQAKELLLHLRELLSNVPVEILAGDKVVEVRPHAANKGRLVAPAIAAAPPGSLIVAMGDDTTDEDLFAALPEGGVAIHVGPNESRAPWRVASVAEARALLAALLPAKPTRTRHPKPALTHRGVTTPDPGSGPR